MRCLHDRRGRGWGVLPRRARAPLRRCRRRLADLRLAPRGTGCTSGGGEEPARALLQCNDVNPTVAELSARGAEIARAVKDEGFGLVTAIRLPGGGEFGVC